jgi:DNA-binding GntR family transcriptional regulator
MVSKLTHVDATSLFEETLARIRNAICDGALSPNERLTQDRIAERLNVSRMPVNQALLLLKAQGFVIDTGRRGVRVAPIDPVIVHDIYAIRDALDPLAARLAVSQPIDAAARDEGRQLLKAGDDALASGSTDALIKADMTFHRFIYRLSGNRFMADLFNLHSDHLRRVMQAVLLSGRAHHRFWEEHRAIFAAIVGGDSERAVKLSHAHVRDAAESVRKALPPAAASSGAAAASPAANMKAKANRKATMKAKS